MEKSGGIQGAPLGSLYRRASYHSNTGHNALEKHNVWTANSFFLQITHIPSRLTAERYVSQVALAAVRTLMQVALGTLFEQDNARPHFARQTLNSVDEMYMLPWPASSPDLSSMEHVWALIGRALNRILPYFQ